MKPILFLIVALVTQSALALDDDYNPFVAHPPSYEQAQANQKAFYDFASRHQVLNSSTNEDGTIGFDIQGLHCVTGLMANRRDYGVTCWPDKNGYWYHTNQNGQLVRGRPYVSPYSNHPWVQTKQCVYQTRLLSYYAECSGRGQ